MRDASLTLNHLLKLSDISPEEVIVFRHRPYEPKLNKVFDWIVSERPDLFDCYQRTQGQKPESALKRAKYAASFIRHSPKTALFVGLFAVASYRELAFEKYAERPLHKELMTFGMVGATAEERASLLEFDLPLTDWHADWRGRLIVKWPGLERSWYRWADRNEFAVEAIAEENLLLRAMPAWDELEFSWSELALLPQHWMANLNQWRGIYLITDVSDGRRYVGSAYGAENIGQRWREYARSGHGGNAQLRLRNAENLRFAILQRVSPDLEDAQVIRVEKSWKDRLRTRVPAGLNEN